MLPRAVPVLQPEQMRRRHPEPVLWKPILLQIHCMVQLKSHCFFPPLISDTAARFPGSHMDYLLEQTSNFSCLIYIDLLSSRYFRQTRHGHDLTGQGSMKPAPANFQVSYGYFKVCRCTSLVWSSVRLYCVLATQIGQLPKPRASNCFACF